LAFIPPLPSGQSGKPDAPLGKIHYNPEVQLTLGTADRVGNKGRFVDPGSFGEPEDQGCGNTAGSSGRAYRFP
jgi:hypothetical protein